MMGKSGSTVGVTTGFTLPPNLTDLKSYSVPTSWFDMMRTGTSEVEVRTLFFYGYNEFL